MTTTALTSTVLAARERVGARASSLPRGLAPRPPAVRTTIDVARHLRGTWVYAGAVLATTIVAARLSSVDLDAVLLHASTNLVNLATHPLLVLIASATWEGSTTWWFLAAFLAVHAVVEHRLGTRRWLVVIAAAQVIGTLVSQGWVALEIARHALSASMATTLDYGISYTVAGALGALTHQLPQRLRGWYAAVLVVIYSLPFWATGPVDFTDIGHLTALAVGLCAVPAVLRLKPRAEPSAAAIQ